MIVDAGARSIELQPRELEVQLRTDLSVARNAPLALYANTTCWCTFDGWSGSHNGTGDAAVQLEPAQRVAIGADFARASVTSQIDAPVVGDGPHSTAQFASSEDDGVVVYAETAKIETRIGANVTFTQHQELVIDELVIAPGPNSNDVRVVGFDATITAIDQATEPDPSEPARYEFAVDDVEVTLDRATGEVHLRLIAQGRHADLTQQPIVASRRSPSDAVERPTSASRT
ncbi:MAG: hypothetical protein HRT86_00410 [Ilumatobacteraceae bacterium]|nr:hypothetical protein [Ilumatobacteraceae bacterium]